MSQVPVDQVFQVLEIKQQETLLLLYFTKNRIETNKGNNSP